MSRKLKLQCPGCQAVLNITCTSADRVDVTCPKCSQNFVARVPAANPGQAPAVPAQPANPIAKPVTAQPVTARPVNSTGNTLATSRSQPVAAQPVAAQPVSAQPVSAQPVSAQPVTAQPASAKPVSSQPASGQPARRQSSSGRPAAKAGRQQNVRKEAVRQAPSQNSQASAHAGTSPTANDPLASGALWETPIAQQPVSGGYYTPAKKRKPISTKAWAIPLGVLAAAAVLIPVGWFGIEALRDGSFSILADSHESLFDDYLAYHRGQMERALKTVPGDTAAYERAVRDLPAEKKRLERFLLRGVRLGKASPEQKTKFQDEFKAQQEEYRDKLFEKMKTYSPEDLQNRPENLLSKEEIDEVQLLSTASLSYMTNGIFDLPKPENDTEKVYYEEAELVREYLSILANVTSQRKLVASAPTIEDLADRMIDVAIQRGKIPQRMMDFVPREYNRIESAFELAERALVKRIEREFDPTSEFEAAIENFGTSRETIYSAGSGLSDAEIRKLLADARAGHSGDGTASSLGQIDSTSETIQTNRTDHSNSLAMASATSDPSPTMNGAGEPEPDSGNEPISGGEIRFTPMTGDGQASNDATGDMQSGSMAAGDPFQVDEGTGGASTEGPFVPGFGGGGMPAGMGQGRFGPGMRGRPGSFGPGTTNPSEGGFDSGSSNYDPNYSPSQGFSDPGMLARQQAGGFNNRFTGAPSIESQLARFSGPTAVKIFFEGSLDPTGHAMNLSKKLGVREHFSHASGNKGVMGIRYSGNLDAVIQLIDFGVVTSRNDKTREIQVRIH